LSEVRRKPDIDYYKVLQVDPSAEPEVIEASYRALSKKYHPDRNSAPGASGRMSQINTAYDVLRDPSKRQDYDQLRNAARFVSHTPTNRPTSSPVSSATSPVSRPTSSTTGYNNGTRPTSGYAGNAATGNGNGSANVRPTGNGTPASPASGTGAYRSQTSNKTAASGKAPRANHNFYAENKGFPWGRWLIILLLIVAGLVGGFFLAKAFFDSAAVSSVIPGLPQSDQTAVANAATSPTRAPAITAATTSVPSSQLNRDLLLNYLNNAELYQGRVNGGETYLLTRDTLQLQVQLARGGRIVNGPDNSPPIQGNDDLDQLRQAEQTTYTLTYALFGRFPDLKELNLSLTDSADDKKVVYRARIPRALAYSFSSWRGTMDPKNLSQQDLIKAASEDRLLAHLGGPVEDTVRSRINQPDKTNLEAELKSWGLPLEYMKVVYDSTGVQVGYYAVRPEEEKLAEYAQIFYALYTRFPTLDRIQVQDTVPGTAARFSKASNRALFNKITPVGWAQYTFDSRAKELFDQLPTALNSPTLNPAPGSQQEAQINPGDNVLVKNWQIVNPPGSGVRLQQFSTFTTSKGQFVLARVLLKNRSTKDETEWPLPNSLFSMVDAQGRTYQPDPVASMAYILDVDRKAPPGPVEPNKDVEMKIIFDIPINASGLRLIFQDGDSRASLPIVSQQPTPTPQPSVSVTPQTPPKP
jgi:hypothetical protein